jgi:HSP20 family protein
MRPIERALEQVRALHDEIERLREPAVATDVSALPPGVDPVAYALQEVARLRLAVEQNRGAAGPSPETPWVPAASVYAGDERSEIVLELPGVDREDVSVRVIGRELVVRGERRPPAPHGRLEPILLEQAWGAFERRFPLPGWCTAESVSARCTHGLLEIRLAGGRSTMAEVQIDID